MFEGFYTNRVTYTQKTLPTIIYVDCVDGYVDYDGVDGGGADDNGLW